jgi:oligopeptide transport system substrate-binding protein
MRALSCHVPLLSLAILLGGCGEVWNNPYPSQDGGGNILYSAFTERPKHLDPVQSYSEDEAEFNSQIYEPPLQYHYLKRPYELVPLTAEAVPRPRYVDAAGRAVAAESPKVAFSVYEIRIRPGILYQPHPAFARDGDGKLRYHDLARQDLQGVHSLRDFPHSGTRELTAEDYVYQIKRLAHPRLHSPVFGLMSEYIVGLKEFAERLKQADAALAAGGRRNAWLDLSQFPLEGVQAVDRYTYRIRIRGRYPQFAYWLAMNFFAPVPRRGRPLLRPARHGREEPDAGLVSGRHRSVHADREQSQRAHGAGAQPELPRRAYPSEGEPAMPSAGTARRRRQAHAIHRQGGVLARARGHPLLEQVPAGLLRFLRHQLGQLRPGRAPVQWRARPACRRKWRRRASAWRRRSAPPRATSPSTGSTRWSAAASPMRRRASGRRSCARPSRSRSTGRNSSRSSPTAAAFPGAGTHSARHLRLQRGRGRHQPGGLRLVGHGAPPGASPSTSARRLLAEAGYPDGRDAKTGQPLVLYLDTTDRGPGDKARSTGTASSSPSSAIQLEIRGTDYNRFQDKVRKGAAQMFAWGWNADYPDPENLLFLLPRSAEQGARTQGENAANYANRSTTACSSA